MKLRVGRALSLETGMQARAAVPLRVHDVLWALTVGVSLVPLALRVAASVPSCAARLGPGGARRRLQPIL